MELSAQGKTSILLALCIEMTLVPKSHDKDSIDNSETHYNEMLGLLQVL